MTLVKNYFCDLFQVTRQNWDRFWFTPADPTMLGLIRILAGAMILYTHAVWTLGLDAFFGPHAWQNRALVSLLQQDGYQWSYWWLIQSASVAWLVHGLGLVVCLMFTLGLWTRVTSTLTCLITLSYAHRAPDAMYGLDQINGFLALYLAIGPSGDAWSLDRWLLRKSAMRRPPHPEPHSPEYEGSRNLATSDSAGLPKLKTERPSPIVSANIAIRLIQIQMCVLYLFAGLSKLQGGAWWDGTALWGAVANLEYQSFDLLWLAHYPWLVNLLTHATIVWEVSFIALIWNRWTRPWVLAMAVFVHLGIGFGLGMITFGLVMVIANLAFVPPEIFRLGRGHRLPSLCEPNLV